MSEELMSVLQRPDGQTRVVCIGCTQILLNIGMLEIVAENPMNVMNAKPGTFHATIYRLTKPFTIEQCQAMIDDRHVGPPAWGE